MSQLRYKQRHSTRRVWWTHAIPAPYYQNPNPTQLKGNTMTAQSLNNIEGWVTILRQYTIERDKAQETIDLARAKIEEALGEAETGELNGVPVIKWTHVTSNRFDSKKAKEILTAEQVESCMTAINSRRFVLLDQEQS